MEFLPGEEVAELLDNITHAETQIAEKGMDLTVSEIYKVVDRGEIDFGGGERKDAKIKKVEISLRNPDDTYGWWNLESGKYLIKYNESLKEEKNALLQPLPRLTRNSATHPTKIVTELEKVLLSVGGKGITIKENSRVSRLIVIEDRLTI